MTARHATGETDPFERAADHLSLAAAPLILVGPEAYSATNAVLRLAELLGAPLLTTPDALSLIDGSRSAGVFSFGASSRARHVVEQADVVLAVSALGEFTCRLGEAFRNHSLIQVVESAADVRGTRRPEVTLLGPPADSLERLTAVLEARACRRETWLARTPDSDGGEVPARAGSIEPRAAILAIRAGLPSRARVCLDITSGALHAYQSLELGAEQRVFSSIENSACMAEALLASLGIRLASDLPTLALVGDWCFCMAPAELHTAVELGLGGYVLVVWSNGGGAFIGAGVRQQRLEVPDAAWRWRHPPNFAAVAQALGAEGKRVSDARELERAVAAGLAAAHPVLIEAVIDPEAPIPAGDRFLTLGVNQER